MRLLNVTKADTPGELIIRAVMREDEYRRLMGNLDGLFVFATKTITERSSVTLTGARHARAKWLLVPKTIRKNFRGEEFDFDRVVCAAIPENGSLCIIFTAPKRRLPLPPNDDASALR